MRIKSMFHVLTFLTAILISSAPLMVLAQRHEPTLEELRRRRAQLQKEEVQAQPETPLKAPELSVRDQAIQDAHKDADIDVNRPMWFIIGCIFPGVGLLSPYFYKPPIPASNMFGKSPEYVTYYTDAYLQKRETLQFQTALGGQATFCLGWCMLAIFSGFANTL